MITKPGKAKLWWSGQFIVSLIMIHFLVANQGLQTVLETVAIIVWGIILLKLIRLELPFNDWAEAHQYHLEQDQKIFLELNFSTTSNRAVAVPPDLNQLSLLAGQPFEKEIIKETKGIKNHA